MSKRRRLVEDCNAGDGSQWQQQHAGPPYGHQGTAGMLTESSNMQGADTGYSTDAVVGSLPQGDRIQSTSYPDVAGARQPYYHQHEAAAAHQSPWPAIDASQQYAEPSTLFAGSSAATGVVQQPAGEQETSYGGGSSSLSLYHNPVNLTLPYEHYAGVDAPSRHGASPYYDDASMHLKIQSLPILDSLATQMIHTLGKVPFSQLIDLMRGTDAEDSQAYITLKNLFDQTRKVYSRDSPFVDALAIQMFQPVQQEIIWKANIATFISSILGAHDVSFFHLNEYYLETFVPLGHRLLKWQGAIFLELKTQTYISALMNSDLSPQAMLDELFPTDLDAQIFTRHPEVPSLSPGEQDFIDRCRARRNYLLSEPSAEAALQELPKKYQWNDFLREFAGCISKNVEGLINPPTRALTFTAPADRKALPQSSAQQGGPQQQSVSSGQRPTKAPQLSGNSGAVANAQFDGNDTQPRRLTVSISTTRQPWTPAEENALLEGLERVSGPHWSQILALYGRGGSVSEVLKDRNQVQLKDKARNLKLWYLKMGRDVPISLRGVTGELRKRGGARARAALGLLDEEVGQGATGRQVSGRVHPELGEAG